EEVVELVQSAPDVPPEPGDGLPEGYSAEAIGVLTKLKPRMPGEDPRRDQGHAWAREFLEDPCEPLLPVTSPRVEAALVRIMRDTGFSADEIRARFPGRIEPDDRGAIRADHLSDKELAMILAADLSHLGDEDEGS
ncbi:MAG: hypothetical protein INR70_26735, partial [Parafilimonas terrae]|nr:hypothetical protein [Parafilimonas terrae]